MKDSALTTPLIAAVLASAVTLALSGCHTNDAAGAADRAPMVVEAPEPAQPALGLVGRPAPSFVLDDHDQQPFDLQARRGEWVVLYFHPPDDMPDCPCHATPYTDLLTQLNGLPVTVVAVNDQPTDMNAVHHARYHLRFALLSDVSGSAAARYGLPRDQPVRATFVIDPAGMVVWAQRAVAAAGHVEQIRSRLDDLRTAAR